MERAREVTAPATKSQTNPERRPVRFIREAECRNRTSLSRSQRWRLEREGRFPARVPLSVRTFGWVEAEIEDWIAARVAERTKRFAA
jgi:predicted DNA-binding transcriptional regulator AlpA